jgi:hypothetical protein
MPSLAGKGQQIFITTFPASDSGKAVVENAAVKITIAFHSRPVAANERGRAAHLRYV